MADDIPTATVVSLPGSLSGSRPSVDRSTSSQLRKKYRGGFHNSICSIFTDPTRRTDCCALACCGVLSSDRTRYLLDGTRPPPLWRRISLYIIVPALFIAAMNYFAVEVTVDESGKTDDQYNETSGEDTGPQKVAPLPLVLSFWAYLVILIMYTRIQRQSTRKEIMKKLYEERAASRGETVDATQLKLFLERNRGDMSAAHRSCCCYATDDVFFNDDGTMTPLAREQTDEEIEGDFCTKLCLAGRYGGELAYLIAITASSVQTR
eukprot:scaffold41942_cov72-Cyclotella_meneghiniana.AAC.11